MNENFDNEDTLPSLTLSEFQATVIQQVRGRLADYLLSKPWKLLDFLQTPLYKFECEKLKNALGKELADEIKDTWFHENKALFKKG